jgi:hypothetical protein
MMDLTIIIPSRNEMFLAKTIEDALAHIEANTDIVAVLDGAEANPPIPYNEKVTVIYVNKAIGQRAGADLAVRYSKAKYIMKIDAHCSFDQGFDRKMLEFFSEVGDDVTAVPTMRNLWAYDWKCYHCGWKKYQGPTPLKCEQCGKTDKIRRKMLWIGKERPQSNSFCFDSTPHFQYSGEYTKRPGYKEQVAEKGYTETMSLQGSCFMSTREKFWELDLGGESLGNWGNQGLQVACATWLSGGRVLVNHRTWYAHMFRTQGGDFGFPYEQKGREVQKTKDNVKDLFWNQKHPKQIHPVSWLVERFAPVNGWDDKALAELKNLEALKQ